ncbi:polysaccharide pyruvyl transferase family protein [Paracoccus caeni]|uniref:Polysaccharide pyruvyl transferase family protein n=1 Tax=Paracoccus caeni TaxID=657651 RepID=A0A934VZI5_9RHOB|nr:polysaccharide pyruvyl transferase family protein [Paracoccus caeni]MBK4214859.1 polysaccharide pyruvyl transferase family protein [Paracoccus caeni]
MSGPSQTHITSQNRHLRDSYAQAIGPLLQGATDYALLDFPYHENIGDSAIYLGELAFLDKFFGRPASYVSAHFNYRGDVDGYCKDGPVLIHGGGNFGDLWPAHHDFRLRVLSDLPHRRVIQLPQSIHFESNESIERTKRAIGAHKDFTLCVRDVPSRDFALREFDCQVVLSPDAAHCIDEVAVRSPQDRILALLRADKEKVGQGIAEYLSDKATIADWPETDVGSTSRMATWIERFYRLGKKVGVSESSLLMRVREQTYRRRSRLLVDAGTQFLSGAEYVVSDRLHAHILCLLLGKTHISMDNVSGKVSAYIAQWGDCGITEWASSPDELRQKVEALP